MDETKIALPVWLPWATTACLAVALACVAELWMIGNARTQLVKDENLLMKSELQASRNQLEAERIVSRRELEDLRASAEPGQVAVLATPDRIGSPEADPPWGFAVWTAEAKEAQIRLLGLPALAADRDYQLWIETGGPGDAQSVIVRPAPDGGETEVSLHLVSPVAPGYRILLMDGRKGGAPSLGEAKTGGSIVLATRPAAEKISH